LALAGRDAIEMDGPTLAAALDEVNDIFLCSPPDLFARGGFALRPMSTYIGCNRHALTTHRSEDAIPHGFAQPMRNEQAVFQRDAKSAMKLVELTPFLLEHMR